MTVHESSFWRRAWNLEEAAREGAVDASLARELRDVRLQDYIFTWLHFDEPTLLAPLAEVDAFARPASEESYWALLNYLAAISPMEPDGVRSALSQIHTNDSRLLERALAVALLLPESMRGPLILTFTDAWLATSAQWFDAQLWSQVRISIASTDTQHYSDIVAELLAAAATVGSSGYELQQFTATFFEEAADDASAILAAVEGGLANILLLSGSFSRRLSLADLQRETNTDAIALLTTTWLRGLKLTAPRVSRAARLLASNEPVLRQLGFTELGRVLSANPSPAVVALFDKVAVDGQGMEWHTSDAFLQVLSAHFERLPAPTQSRLVDEALERAQSADRLDQYTARDLLSSMHAQLGPREREVLSALVAEYGPYEPRRPTAVEASWVTTQGPMPLEQMRALTVQDLLALMVWAPAPSDATPWGGSPLQGLVAQVTTLAAERPNQLLELLQNEGRQVANQSLHAAVVDGVAAAVKSGMEGIELSSYIAWMNGLLTENIRREDDQAPELRRAICRALLSLSEVASSRASAPTSQVSTEVRAHAQELAQLISLALNDPSPRPEEEREWRSLDLLTISLNVNRGIAARAAYTLLAAQAGQELEELTQALVRLAVEEESPAVLSVVGSHLALVRSLPEDRLWRAARRVMQFDSFEWAAIFDGYVTSHGPSRLDDELLEFFEKAVDRYGDESTPWVAAHWDSVLVHLAVAFLREQPDRWTDVLGNALRLASPSQATEMYRTLGAAFRRGGTDFQAGRLVELAGFATELVRRGGSTEVASAAAGMLVFGQVPLGSAGGVLLDLTRLGAQVDLASLLALLARDAETTPGLSVALLQSVFSAEQPLWQVSRSAESLNSVLLTLGRSEANHHQVVALVDQLGAQGLFSTEPAAKELITRLSGRGN